MIGEILEQCIKIYLGKKLHAWPYSANSTTLKISNGDTNKDEKLIIMFMSQVTKCSYEFINKLEFIIYDLIRDSPIVA